MALIKKCRICGNLFNIRPYRKNTAFFCSNKCRGIWVSEMKKGCSTWNKGLTKETDNRILEYSLKISKSLLGNKRRIGKIPWNKDKQMWGIREHPKGMKGKTPWNYIDGRSNDPKPRQMYGNKPYSHYIWCIHNQMVCVPKGCVIHHKDLNPENNEPDNLVLLSDKYHRQLHTELIKIMKGGVL
jgi:hypothetical protein